MAGSHGLIVLRKRSGRSCRKASRAGTSETCRRYGIAEIEILKNVGGVSCGEVHSQARGNW